jgi:hypothetical protein
LQEDLFIALNEVGISEINAAFIETVNDPMGYTHDPYILRVTNNGVGLKINITLLKVRNEWTQMLPTERSNLTPLDEDDDVLQQELWQVDRMLAAFSLARAMGKTKVFVDVTNVSDAHDKMRLWVMLAVELARNDGFSVAVNIVSNNPREQANADAWLTTLQNAPPVLTLVEVLACM